MPSWNNDPDPVEYHECGQARLTVAGEQASLLPLPDALIPSTPDPDAIEQPTPYTTAEWNETEGAGVFDAELGAIDPQLIEEERQRDHAYHLTHSERVQEAGYDLNDPKGYSVL